MDLLHRVADDVARRLLAVPGALHAQHVDDALERDELLAEQGVVEGLARGDGEQLEGAAGSRPARRAARGAQLARQLRAAGAGERNDDIGARGAATQVVEAFAVGRVQLQQPAEAGVGGLGHELPELALEADRDEDGAAAGDGPQRGCGRKSGGGADVHEREAHAASPGEARLRATERRRWPRPEAAGLGEAVSFAGS